MAVQEVNKPRRPTTKVATIAEIEHCQFRHIKYVNAEAYPRYSRNSKVVLLFLDFPRILILLGWLWRRPFQHMNLRGSHKDSRGRPFLVQLKVRLALDTLSRARARAVPAR